MKITTSAYNKIIKTLGSKPAEQGGIGVGKDGIITDFIHDKNARTSGGTYELNTPYLNPRLKEFAKQGKKLKAIIHTHPKGYGKLSPQDEAYFKSQFKNFPELEKLYTPIIYSAKDGEYHFFPYVIYPDGRVEKEELEIVPDNYQDYISKNTVETATTNKEVVPQIIREVVKSEGKVIINVQPANIQQTAPNVFIIEKDKAEPKPKEKIEKQEIKEEKPLKSDPPQLYFLETEKAEKTFFNKIYHSFLIAFLLFVLVMALFLSPSIYQFFKTLLN